MRAGGAKTSHLKRNAGALAGGVQAPCNLLVHTCADLGSSALVDTTEALNVGGLASPDVVQDAKVNDATLKAFLTIFPILRKEQGMHLTAMALKKRDR